MTDFDVAVIGAGIAGASAGYELARDHEVVVIDQEPIAGYHTTGRSAAAWTEAYERGPVQALARASLPFLMEPPNLFAGTPLLSPMPVLIVATEDQESSFARFLDSAPAGAIEVLEGDALRAACPVLGDAIVVGALEAKAREIDVSALHQGYLAGVRLRDGAVMLDAPVTALESGGHWWRIGAGGTTITASIVINAAGAWGDEVARMAGIEPLGLTPYRRTAFTFPAPENGAGWPMTVDVDEGWYFKPQTAQFLGSLAEETPMEPHDVSAEEADVALAIERIEAATTLRIRRVTSAWAGLRTFTEDRFPAIGFEPGHRGFFWLVGQGGFGIMTAPAAARTAAALVANHRIPADVADEGLDPDVIDPARFREHGGRERHPVPSVGAVIIDEGRILLVRRDRGAYAGAWAVPAGRQRRGETMVDAVRREVREETGLEVAVGDPVWIGDILDPGYPPEYHYTVVDYAAFVTGGELRAGSDAAEARWVELSEVRELHLTPTMEEMLERLGY